VSPTVALRIAGTIHFCTNNHRITHLRARHTRFCCFCVSRNQMLYPPEGQTNWSNPPNAPMSSLVFTTSHFLSRTTMPALVFLQAILVLLALAQCAPSRRCCSRLACCTTVCCAALLACAVSADQADCLVSVGALAAPVQELLRRQRGPGVPGVSCACCLLLCFASIVRASKNETRLPHPHPPLGLPVFLTYG
jgi:hypothetical protein